MRRFRLISFIVLLSLLFFGCDKKDIIELPPPSIHNNTDGGNTDNPDSDTGPDTDDTPNEWDSNRGKLVRPSGPNWASKSIDDGVVYYTFDGKEDISGVRQQIFIIDLDLSKTQYTTKLVYTSPRKVPSDAFKLEEGTVAVMNANYEPASIYIRVNKSLISNMPNSVIGTTTVPNWKNDGAFGCDRARGVKFYYAGCQKTGEVTLAQQRIFYSNVSSVEAPDLISSGPVLIHDFSPMGLTYCTNLTTAQINELNSEDPDRHQGTRQPRSAVALTEDNHFLMIAVDGRHSGYSSGMTAEELTRFLVTNFNPQYALNMDGGGSTAMCVKGEGDATTHVVNYPCDSSDPGHNHAGERSRDVHFVIVKK